MKRLALFCGVLLLFAGVASAQDAPKAEVFGGYSFLHVSNDGGSANFNGGTGSLAYNLTPWLGVVGDVGGYHWSQSSTDESANAVTYLFGPKISYRRGPITPFVQVLVGGAHLSGSETDCGTARVHHEGTAGGGCVNLSQNAFALTFGGGVDWNATPHIGIRVVQAEYLMTRFNEVTGNNQQNNARISTGVVFRW